MVRLGLLGKNIQHSKSKLMYETILNKKISYSLFDYETKNEIPPLMDLFNDLDGLSITAPYKTVFNDFISLSNEAQISNSVNCIRLNSQGQFEGHNTDFLACDDIISSNLHVFDKRKLIVLGNGAMSRVVVSLLNKYSIQYFHLYRRPGFEINDYTFDNDEKCSVAVINCCSRGFIFKPSFFHNIDWFWDLNYGQDDLYNFYTNNIYHNGLPLLNLQAKYAIDIWGIK